MSIHFLDHAACGWFTALQEFERLGKPLPRRMRDALAAELPAKERMLKRVRRAVEADAGGKRTKRPRRKTGGKSRA